MSIATGLRTRDATVPVLGVLSLVEAAGLVACARGGLGAPALLAGHVLCLAVAAAVLRAFPGPDRSFAVLALLLAASTGPLGACGTLLLRAIVARSRIGAKELADWYQRLAGIAMAEASTALYDSIVDGRARRPTHGAVDHFPSVLQGDLAQQQALLGLISLVYHPDYRPILAQALCSAEPSIRVHAAAVAVKLRARTLTTLKRTQDAIASGAAGNETALAGTLLDLADGGFLDEAKARAAREDALALCRRAREERPGDGEAARLARRALVDLGSPNGADTALEDAGPASDPQDLKVRMRGLMQRGEARALHALLAGQAAMLGAGGRREAGHVV